MILASLRLSEVASQLKLGFPLVWRVDAEFPYRAPQILHAHGFVRLGYQTWQSLVAESLVATILFEIITFLIRNALNHVTVIAENS